MPDVIATTIAREELRRRRAVEDAALEGKPIVWKYYGPEEFTPLHPEITPDGWDWGRCGYRVADESTESTDEASEVRRLTADNKRLRKSLQSYYALMRCNRCNGYFPVSALHASSPSDIAAPVCESCLEAQRLRDRVAELESLVDQMGWEQD